MRWFSRAKPRRFPDDMPNRLDLLGRFELDPQTSGIDPGEVAANCVVPFWQDATADPDGFLAELHALVLRCGDGFAAYGASELVWEMYGGTALDMPAALPIIDAGIDFKLARGLSSLHLTGYEADRLIQRGDGDGHRP